MRLSAIVKRLETEYEKAKKNPSIYKPMSFALYKVWRWCDTYEKERNND